ncbi:MAG: hypothetical protein ACOY3L_18695 [Pseudomonadota bacterium]
MAEVNGELTYEILKQLQDRSISMDHKLDELKAEMQASSGHLVAVQQDIHNIYMTLARHETRLDRIDRRLGLLEPAAP